MPPDGAETLVLDYAYQPIERKSWQDAMVDWCNDKVDILASYTDYIIHRGRQIAMPAVIRFRNPFTRNKHSVKFSRFNVYLRDRGACQYCGIKVHHDDFQYEHVVPRKQGGRTNFTNIVVACARCNIRKGNRTPEQAGMRLRNGPPTKPKYLPPRRRADLVWRDSYPDAWRPYLPTRDEAASYAYWHDELEQS